MLRPRLHTQPIQYGHARNRAQREMEIIRLSLMEKSLEVMSMYDMNINFVLVFLPTEFKIHRM